MVDQLTRPVLSFDELVELVTLVDGSASKAEVILALSVLLVDWSERVHKNCAPISLVIPAVT